MSFRNVITEKVIFLLSDKILGQSISEKLKFLKKSQYWDKKQIDEFQNERLQELIKHSYESVPYYHDLFNKLGLKPSDIKDKSDLCKIPIVTKDIIKKEGIERFTSSLIPAKQRIKNSSSGSTGEPLQYYETKESYSMNIAANLRGWYNMGYRLGDRYIKLSVNPRNRKVKKLQDFINNCIYFSSKGVTVEDVLKFIDLIHKKMPRFIRGYPSTLSVIANYIVENNITVPMVKAINTTGEILFPQMKKIIEQAFNTKVFDSYSGEGGAVMFQDKSGIYNIAHEYAITEIVNENGMNINSGVGEVVSTDLWNFAHPFIRYAVRDSIEIFDEHNPNKPMRAKRILGRNVDMLKTPSGKTLIVHFFTGYFEWVTTVKQFQIRQDSPEDFVLNLVVKDNFTLDDKNKIFKDVNDYIGPGAKLTINIVDSIPAQKNGKTRFMIKNY